MQEWCRAQCVDVQSVNDGDASASALSTRVDHVLVSVSKAKGRSDGHTDQQGALQYLFFGYPHDRAWCLLHGTKDATFLLTICPFSYCYQPGIFSMLNESYLRVSHE
jgi:hypothetical protein